MISQEEATFDNIFNSKIEEIKSSFEEIRNNEFDIKTFSIMINELNVNTHIFQDYTNSLEERMSQY